MAAHVWLFRTTALPDRGTRFAIDFNGEPASFRNIVEALRFDSSFRSAFNASLSQSPYAAFRWETPAATTVSISQPFEYVLIESPELDRVPDPTPFAGHLGHSRDGVVVFTNLGGDAVLIAPSPMTSHSAYGHLGAFVRNAPEQQRQALWQSVGEALTARVGDKPVWLSTAGAGVAWLHIRIDDRPKYYVFTPYKKSSGAT